MPKPSSKAKTKPASSRWSPRNLFARLLGRIAMMLIVIGLASPFLGDKTRDLKWPVAVCMVAVGVALAFVTARLKKMQ